MEWTGRQGVGKVVEKVSHVQHTWMDTRGDQYRDSDTHKDTRRHEDRHTGTFNRETQRHRVGFEPRSI